MNTGLLSLLFRQQPWQFNGLYVLGDILYVFELVLFVVFMICLLLRYSLYPQRTLNTLAANVDDLGMLGTMPIAWNTFAALTAIIASNAPWGGYSFSLLAYALWWIGTAWMTTTAIAVFVTLTQSWEHSIRKNGQIPATVFLPIVGLATDAVAGASICAYGYNISARLAVPVIIVCYFILGIATWVSVFLYAGFTWRLMTHGWPAPMRRPALFLLIGPFGQCASAFLLLSYAVQTKMDFANYNRGTLLTAMSASGVSAASEVLGLLCLGGDFFWYFISIAGLLEAAYRRTLGYSLFWWSTIFPIGTTNISFIALATSTQGDAFKALSAIWTIFLAIDYILNWGFTIWHSITGDLLVKGEEFEIVKEPLEGDDVENVKRD